MARTKTRSISGLTADDNGLVAAQNTVAGTPLTLILTTLSPPRRLSFDASGSMASINFTIVGKDRFGNDITEVVTGVTTTAVASVGIFATVTSITPDATDAVNTIIVGWTAEVISAPIMLNHYRESFNVGLGARVTGTVTYSVQHTFDDLQAAGTTDGDGNWFEHASMTGLSAHADGNYAFAVEAIRLIITAGTGSVELKAIQSGN